jgi:hypothetical protein
MKKFLSALLLALTIAIPATSRTWLFVKSTVPPPDPCSLATNVNSVLVLDAIDSPHTDAGGGKVSQWNDLSPSHNNAVQATGANQPTYNATGTSTGLPTMVMGANPIRFDLTSDIALTTATIFAVMQVDTALTANDVLGNVTLDDALVLFNNGGTAASEWYKAPGYMDWNVPGRTDAALYLFTVKSLNTSANTSVTMYSNGSVGSLIGGPGNATNPTYNTIGFSHQGGDYGKLLGRISGLYILNTALADGPRGVIESCLISRWGII